MKRRIIALLLALVLLSGIPYAMAEDMQTAYAAAQQAFSQGDFTSAAELLTDALLFAPQEASLFFYRAMAYERLGDFASALTDYSLAAAFLNDPFILTYRAPLLQSLQLYGQAAWDIDQALISGAGTENDYSTAAHVLGLLGYQQEAMETLEQGFIAYPDSVGLIAQRGIIHYQQGDFGAALMDYETVLAAGLEDPVIYYNIAEASFLLGKDDSAKEAAEKSVAKGGMNSTRETADANYAALKKNVQRPTSEEQAALFESAQAKNQSLIEAGKYMDAMDDLLLLTNDLPGNAELLALCAEGWGLAENPRLKTTFYAMAFSAEPTSMDYFEKTAKGYEALGLYDDYAIMRGILVHFNPENAFVHCDFAFALRTVEQYERALSEYNRAIELDDTKSLYFGGRGDLLLQMKRYEEAEKDYERCLELDPTDFMAEMSLEICRAMLGKESSIDPNALSDEMKTP